MPALLSDVVQLISNAIVARRKLKILWYLMHAATQRPGDAGIVDNDRLNDKAKAVVYKLMEQRYAAT